MKTNRVFVVAMFGFTSLVAADETRFYGTWGTQKQCDGGLITANGTMYWKPFNIDAGWLRHNEVWCRLSWINSTTTKVGVYGIANAFCGEDDNRDYRITFSLINQELTLSWGNEFTNAGLMRCAIK